MTRRKKVLLATGAAVLLIGTGAIAARRHRAPDIPTAEVERKEFIEYQQARGEVKAQNSVSISAPFGAGDLQILTLSRTGAMVKKGDVVVQFDTTSVKVNYEQKQSGLRSADAQIRQSEARARLDKEQRRTDMLNAEYNVERAQLDARKQEILSEIEAEKTRLVLADKQQKFAETQVTVASSEVAGRANTESVKLKRQKAVMDVNLAQRQLASLTLRAPVAGMIMLSPNYRANGGNSEGNAPEFKAGDRVWSGASIAEIPDLSSLRVILHVDEIDRGQIRLNQSALIRVDAVPDREFNAYVAEISALGKPDFSTWPPPRNFDVVLQIKDPDSRLRPGMSANVRIVLERIREATVVPSEAVFEKNGRTLVYVLRGSRFVERTVTIASRASGECRISSGLQAGERVALKDPNPEAGSRK